jgi:nucleotide-binding universal stress UspA family protein
MKTIIVPVELSEKSLRGLELARVLANRTSAKIEMFHVITEVNAIPADR